MPGLRAGESAGHVAVAGRGWAMKNRQMTWVASSAVDGGSVPKIRCASGFDVAPGHWWPTPAMVMSSTARPEGQLATEVVTVPAVVIAGDAQRTMHATARGLEESWRVQLGAERLAEFRSTPLALLSAADLSAAD
jgi:hypothetical protein